jgi:hypothetical protein
VSTSLALVPVALVGAASLIDLPYSRGEVEDVLGYVAQNARDTDQVYLYYGIRLAERYYEPRIPGIITRGTCSHDDPTGYYDELERLRGNPRVWVVMAHDFYGEHDLLRNYMQRNAATLDAYSPRNADATLYAFTSSNRTVPSAGWLRPVTPANPATTCRGIFAS